MVSGFFLNLGDFPFDETIGFETLGKSDADGRFSAVRLCLRREEKTPCPPEALDAKNGLRPNRRRPTVFPNNRSPKNEKAREETPLYSG